MYTGVKTFISKYHEVFDAQTKANKKAKAELKAEGERATADAVKIKALEILEEWKKKTQLGTDAHTFIHNRELKKYPDAVMGVYESSEGQGELNALEINKLERGKLYFEKQIVSNHHFLIGWADKVEVTKDGFINIEDYKSWDEVYRSSSFVVDNGFRIKPKYFLAPIDHVDDSNLNFATLQLSMYMYILWTYNKSLKPGTLHVKHLRLNEDGNIVNEELIQVPYMREEVRALLKNKKLIGA